MPRPNRARSIASEANLAKRIAYERHQRDLSYEGLAKLMTEAGCAIQGSAIYKIEKGDPPRRVTVDELVALARVFEATIEELLTPIELIEQRQAKELIAELDRVTEQLADTTVRLFNMYIEYGVLTINNPELGEYVDHHWEAATEGDFPVATMPDIDDPRLNEAAGNFSAEIVAAARTLIVRLAEPFMEEVAELATENVMNALETGEAGLAAKGRVR
jgi:transcriptional regulator with XRE-family HTH domain